MSDVLGGYPVPTPQTRKMAQAIARAEGFYVAGSVPARAHNPGDLKLSGYPTLEGTSISFFSSDDEGWSKLYRQIDLIRDGKSAYYKPTHTILQMGQKWTATVNEQSAWASHVASSLGVSVNTTLGEVLNA